ncbi:pyridoxal-phosphate dependent enzyme [Nocardia puris]|uniref:D-cysteine desulfhydrase n=1 Tax=Nocardia puris TaxID=208602 RepID=A0A366DGG3_9NOCA|nr:pyridoxal-phosphate dependent enzyme [Nocardia puris]MBF6212020.1 pyridoxal-phosphate dependent enzyme [Nocardia puris]MBF6367046.1 pyridoxal-phosphate dependent enzyme [Nocardia puris]MBF6461977.1 pyridoxal-phosphate dependent enzyme [Nocardia puris]RBO88434.1 D-cysteine desulfhydrase [Nocardia puris]
MTDSRLHSRCGLSPEIVRADAGSPTPVRRLSGDGLWLKDDGVYGCYYGGNKLRKLEWLLPAAARGGARVLCTASAAGAAHGLATAAAARRVGITTHVAVVDQPPSPEVDEQMARLRRVATVHHTRTVRRTYLAAPAIFAAAASRHRSRPRIIPAGGSSVRGMLGYVEAGLELAEQVRAGALPCPDRVVLPVGTGGTAAGLATGLHLGGLSATVMGVIINDRPRCDERRLRRLLVQCHRFLRAHGVGMPEGTPHVELRDEWLGAGYGHPTASGTAAVARAAGDDGVSLDPVCSGKAFAAARELAGEANVLFWNTFDARAAEFFPGD